ncbi:MAG: phosphodiester glycosidase family protein [Thermoclostridium sp.]|nr:phosphodiester glycosidase family protein [Thermoclostridium sp.]
MKKLWFTIVSGFILWLMLSFAVMAQQTASLQSLSVQFSGGSREVKFVQIDLKDPLYRAEVVLANKNIGKVEPFIKLAEQPSDSETEVIAAINGTFFNSYSDLQPVGNLQIRGKTAYITNSGTSIGFAADNTIRFEHLFTTVSGCVNGMWEYPYNWSVWGINQVYSRSDANILYTPDFGKQVDAANKTAIITRNKKVVEIKKGVVPIYSDGYTLVFGAEVYASMFKLGDKVDYRINYNQIDYSNGGKKGNPVQWSDIRSTLGAGPLLVQGGKNVLDAQKEGYTDKKFTGAAQRSFIGVTKEQVLVFGTVPSVTLKELAEILLKLGVQDGMNLDGGASSALYFKGQVVTKPSREISNAIVITRKKTRPIRLQLNGTELFLDTDPYFENQTTMVPMRGIMEALGAEAGWEPDTGTLWAMKGDTRVEMWNGSDLVSVNGTERKLLAPCRVVYNRTHVPARFMTELFGGEIRFDAERNMVVMTLENAKPDDLYEKAVLDYENGKYAEAVALFLKVLEDNPHHAGASLKLARHYAAESDYRNAIVWYENYLTNQTKDYDVWNSLGWAYANLSELPKAMEIFEMLTRVKPEEANYWIALGDIYAHYQIQDMTKAKQCYEQALSCANTESQKLSVQSRLQKFF